MSRNPHWPVVQLPTLFSGEIAMKLGSLLVSVIAVAVLASPSFAQVSEADRLARCQNNQTRIDALENEIKNSDDLMTVEQLARARADLLSARQKLARTNRAQTDIYAMQTSEKHIMDYGPEETDRLR